MDTAAVVIPIPVQPVEPPAQPPGTKAPAEGGDADGTGFASALEQQLAQAPAAAAKAAKVQKALPGEDTDAPAKTAAEGEAAASPDALIALIAAPFVPQSARQPVSGEGHALRSAVHGEADNRLPAAGVAGREPREAAPRHEPAPLAAPAPERVLPAAEREVATATHVPATPDLAAVAAAAPLLHAPETQHAAHAAPAAQPLEAHVAARVGTPEWGDGLARQVTLMVKDGEQTAQLRLDPPELGPLEVRLSMTRGDDSVAQVQFISAHAPVRDALEAALPQLRAALAESGITLGQASVGEGYAREDAREAFRSGGNRAGGGEAGTASAAPRAIVRHGLVDTFA